MIELHTIFFWYIRSNTPKKKKWKKFSGSDYHHSFVFSVCYPPSISQCDTAALNFVESIINKYVAGSKAYGKKIFGITTHTYKITTTKCRDNDIQRMIWIIFLQSYRFLKQKNTNQEVKYIRHRYTKAPPKIIINTVRTWKRLTTCCPNEKKKQTLFRFLLQSFHCQIYFVSVYTIQWLTFSVIKSNVTKTK